MKTVGQYAEMTIEGAPDLARGFILGFLTGRGMGDEAMFIPDEHIKQDGGLVNLLRLMRFGEDRTHVVVGERLIAPLTQALEKLGNDLDLRIGSIRGISGACFNFRFKTFSKPYGEAIKALFAAPPEGVRIDGYRPVEKIITDAKGIEAYAPLHDYAIEGSGQVIGPAGPVLDFYGRIERQPLVALADIELVYDDRAGP